MPESDDAILAALAGEPEEPRPQRAERSQGKRALVQVGRDLALGEPVELAQPFLQGDAGAHRAIDEHLHEPCLISARDQPMRLAGRHVEAARDLALREAAHEVEPGCPRRQAVLILHCDT